MANRSDGHRLEILAQIDFWGEKVTRTLMGYTPLGGLARQVDYLLNLEPSSSQFQRAFTNAANNIRNDFKNMREHLTTCDILNEIHKKEEKKEILKLTSIEGKEEEKQERIRTYNAHHKRFELYKQEVKDHIKQEDKKLSDIMKAATDGARAFKFYAGIIHAMRPKAGRPQHLTKNQKKLVIAFHKQEPPLQAAVLAKILERWHLVDKFEDLAKKKVYSSYSDKLLDIMHLKREHNKAKIDRWNEIGRPDHALLKIKDRAEHEISSDHWKHYLSELGFDNP